MEKPTDNSFSVWAVREVDHLFSAFRRYTRFVFFSKWFLGVFALVLMSSLIAYPLLTKSRDGMRVSFVGSANNPGSAAASPVMNNPEFRGTDDKGQQYKINGIRAIQQTQDLVVIEQMNGILNKPNNSYNTLKADRAELQQQEKILNLYGNVTVTDDTGYVFVTPHATVNTLTMDVDGTDQVQGNGPEGNLLAIGFKIRDNGNDIFFGGTGRVNVVIDKMRADRK